MKIITSEQKALIFGVIINFISAVVGFVFFGLTQSMSILLDGLISAILCVSTTISMFVSNFVNKDETKNYPLGRYAIENMFVLFRSILMLGTIAFTMMNGIVTIVNFVNSSASYETINSSMLLIIYGVVMTGLCFLITFVYSYFNKKNEIPSQIIRIEIKASLYDGLVTLLAVSSLLLFSNLDGLARLQPIGDSITLIILSCLYIYSPIKELLGQVNVLTDKRRFEKTEGELFKTLKDKYQDFNFYDIYYSFSGNVHSIYVTLMPKNNIDSQELKNELDKISKYLYETYPFCKVYLLLSEKKIHEI